MLGGRQHIALVTPSEEHLRQRIVAAAEASAVSMGLPRPRAHVEPGGIVSRLMGSKPGAHSAGVSIREASCFSRNRMRSPNGMPCLPLLVSAEDRPSRIHCARADHSQPHALKRGRNARGRVCLRLRILGTPSALLDLLPSCAFSPLGRMPEGVSPPPPRLAPELPLS
jgi:hypothetical protein